MVTLLCTTDVQRGLRGGGVTLRGPQFDTHPAPTVPHSPLSSHETTTRVPTHLNRSRARNLVLGVGIGWAEVSLKMDLLKFWGKENIQKLSILQRNSNSSTTVFDKFE